MEYREYAYGSQDYKKALILRVCVLGLAPGIDDFLSAMVYSPEEKEKDYFFLGAFDKDTISATLNLILQEDGSLLLRQFAVHSSCQGQGIGMNLIRFAHEFARQRGYKKIFLDSRLSAVGFYQKAGYRLTGTRKVYPEITLDEMCIDL